MAALLERNHYAVDAVYDGREALDYLAGGNYDALILDIMMPKMDGMEVLRCLRQEGNSIPVLMLTAKGEVEDKVRGLDSGANDYLTKPFATEELLARLRAMTRHSVQLSSQLTFGNLCLDQTTFELSTSTGSFRLANKEYQMMELFLRNPRQIIPTERFWSGSGAMTARWRYRWYGSISPTSAKALRAAGGCGDPGQPQPRICVGGADMIQKLRVKFIIASMLSLALVLLVILGGVNAMSYQKVVRDADRILDLLSENRGVFPQQTPPDGREGKPGPSWLWAMGSLQRPHLNPAFSVL